MNRLGGQRGITLVEVAVSALIMGLTFAGVVTMVQKSREVDFEGDLYLQARRLAHSALEEGRYHHSNFNALTEEIVLYDPLEIYPSVNSDRTIAVDKVVVVSAPLVTESGWLGRQIPYYLVTAVISWEGGAKSVSASKRVARVSG